MSSSTHYSVLELSAAATPKEIKKAYHKLAKLHHPDKTGSDGELFKDINEAYRVLSDTNLRTSYDIKLAREKSFNNIVQRQPPPTATQFEQRTGFYRQPSTQSSQPSAGFHAFQTRTQKGSSTFQPNNHSAFTYGTQQYTRPAYQYGDEYEFAYNRNQPFSTRDTWSRYANSNNPPYVHTQTQFHQTQTPNSHQFHSTTTQFSYHSSNGADAKTSSTSSAYNNGSASVNNGSTFNKVKVENPQPTQKASNNNNNPTVNNTIPKPPGVDNHNNNYHQGKSQQQYRFTEGENILPSRQPSTIPPSWKKQNLNFNSKNSYSENTKFDAFKYKKDTSSKNPKQQHNNDIDRNANTNKQRDFSNRTERGTPPLHEIKVPPNATPLKFDSPVMSNSKPSPQRVQTRKHQRVRSFHVIKPPVKRPVQYKNSSGRPIRTSLEENSEIEFVTAGIRSTLGSKKFNEDSYDENSFTYTDETNSTRFDIRTREKSSGNNGNYNFTNGKGNDDDHDTNKLRGTKFKKSHNNSDLEEIDEDSFRRGIQIQAVPTPIKHETQESSNSRQKSVETIDLSRETSANTEDTFQSLKDIKNTPPFTQTNGNFNMNNISSSLKHTLSSDNDDDGGDDNYDTGPTFNQVKEEILKKRRGRKKKKVDLNLSKETLHIHDDFMEMLLEPTEPHLEDPFNEIEWKEYNVNYQEFHRDALQYKTALLNSLSSRCAVDTRYIDSLISRENMDVQILGIKTDALVLEKLVEIQKLLERVVTQHNEYSQLKNAA